MKSNYEIYFGKTEQNRTKTFLVFPNRTADLAQARRYFKCTYHNIRVTVGYVLNGELYFENPHKKGTKMVTVCYWTTGRA